VVTSRSGSAPVHSNVNVPSRRDVILSGLIGSVASLAAPAVAAPQTLDISTSSFRLHLTFRSIGGIFEARRNIFGIPSEPLAGYPTEINKSCFQNSTKLC
jgi:hypothetical protein